jgi:hypothetical protein
VVGGTTAGPVGPASPVPRVGAVGVVGVVGLVGLVGLVVVLAWDGTGVAAVVGAVTPAPGSFSPLAANAALGVASGTPAAGGPAGGGGTRKWRKP